MIFTHLLRLIYPKLCVVCGTNLMRGENEICIGCIVKMPRTNMHLQKDNAVEKRFWGKVNVQRASSFFYFEKGSNYQRILHSLKYKNNKEIGYIMGTYAASELLSNDYFSDVDIILPVPLHPNKLQKRGYNQSECICQGLSEILRIPYSTEYLIRTQENTTQTKKSVFDRHTNTKGIFSVIKPEELEGKHLLIVDDVLTTGATIEGCISELEKIRDISVSVFTLAVAR